MCKSVIEEKFDIYYPKTNLKSLNYKIENFGGIEKTTITFNESLMCPIYCICDGHYMMWYGDHGSFSFDCTWNTSIFNIPFNSPNYLFEKFDVTSIDGSAGKEFNPEKCEEETSNYLYESDWWEELSDYNKGKIKGYLTTDKWCPDIDDYKLSKDIDKYLVEDIRKLIKSSHDRYDFIINLRDLDRDGSPFFECYDLYRAGESLSPHFWFILRCLFEVVNREKEKEVK